ncbi:MAG: hypothetical protein KC457_04560, partial [Myxococcales bacterium]|nr:hypothetical protein [Myxococcales bacterium]
PGSSVRHAFEIENPVPLAFLPSLEGNGAWDPALAADEGRVEMVWQPARAFDGLELDTLSELDLAFFSSQNLGRGVRVLWHVGEP